MGVLLASSKHHVHQVPNRAEKGLGPPGTAVTDCCEVPAECWELNWGPLQQEQPVLNH